MKRKRKNIIHLLKLNGNFVKNFLNEKLKYIRFNFFEMPRITLPRRNIDDQGGYPGVNFYDDVNNLILDLIENCEEKYNYLSEHEQKILLSSLDNVLDFYNLHANENHVIYYVNDIKFDLTYYDGSLDEFKTPMDDLLVHVKEKLIIRRKWKPRYPGLLYI